LQVITCIHTIYSCTPKESKHSMLELEILS
jgi:hypothetical protein